MRPSDALTHAEASPSAGTEPLRGLEASTATQAPACPTCAPSRNCCIDVRTHGRAASGHADAENFQVFVGDDAVLRVLMRGRHARTRIHGPQHVRKVFFLRQPAIFAADQDLHVQARRKTPKDAHERREQLVHEDQLRAHDVVEAPQLAARASSKSSQSSSSTDIAASPQKVWPISVHASTFFPTLARIVVAQREVVSTTPDAPRRQPQAQGNLFLHQALEQLAAHVFCEAELEVLERHYGGNERLVTVEVLQLLALGDNERHLGDFVTLSDRDCRP